MLRRGQPEEGPSARNSNVIEDYESSSEDEEVHWEDTSVGPPEAPMIVPPLKAEHEAAWRLIQNEIAVCCLMMNEPEQQETPAIRTALMVCPHLLWIESNPFRYVERHDRDASKVAKALFAYWECRVELFGVERAFLPLSLDQRSASALRAEELALLRTGLAVINHGAARRHFRRSVSEKVMVRTNPMRRFDTDASSAPPVVRLRHAFYLYNVISEYTAAQSAGILAVHVCRDANFRAVDAVTLRTGCMMENFPIRTIENHFFDCRPNGVVRGWGLLQCLLVFILQYASYFHEHVDDRTEWLDEMEGMGYNGRDLPVDIGGTWDPDPDIEAWMTARMGRDYERYGQQSEQCHSVHDVQNQVSELRRCGVTTPNNAKQLRKAETEQRQVRQESLAENERLQSLLEAAQLIVQHNKGKKRHPDRQDWFV